MSAVQAAVPRTPTRTDLDNPALAIAAVGSCGLLVALLQTMVVPLLPQFPALLSVSASTASWLVTATLVAGAVSAPVLGRLGDMYGKRRMLLVSVWIVLGSSLLAAVAPNFAVLLVARALQGVSFGVIALGMSLMRDVLPPERVGTGVGLMSSSLGIGGAAGPPLTGFIAQHGSWRVLFLAVAAGALVLGLLVPRFVAESRVRTGGRFDTIGAVGLGIGLVCLLLGISKGSAWGWSSAATLGSLGAAVVVLVLWGYYELGRRSPLVDLRVSARPAVLWTNVATVLLGFSIFATFVMATQVLQAPVGTGYGFGLSITLAGVLLLPIGGAMVVFSSVSARISQARGPRTTVLLGAALLTLGNAGFALLPSSLWPAIGTATVGAIGAALAYSALPLLIMRAVPETETAAANSMNTLMRQLGTSTITAVAAAVGAAMVVEVDGQLLPSGGAFTVSFLAASGAALLALVVAALTPAPREEPGEADAVRPACAAR
ncbi:Major Facilitator Superfamily protein [Pseudonocardia ammonioxydans]|uniref:Major Facilitator Superfamily protein n=1 Tax=Pseudonocardia ammonioxydans TaxID=260086 RepID=A0A1I5A0U2_PSUAM|nr:MFS transporter [Pseudonocardia ammonioxydans]SFN56018.1 Major Facilitator Superfamily protein [Pseudonocardia ammonioxydans]